MNIELDEFGKKWSWPKPGTNPKLAYRTEENHRDLTQD
jgi:hypothetical protein